MSVFDPDAMIAPLTTRAESLSAASDAPAVLVASYRDGRYAEAAAGVSDLESGVAAEPGQTFEIGSQSKLITAVVVLQLVAEGKLDLDAPASDWLPASVTNGIANAGTATVRQLLQMRSGVPSYTEAVDGNGEPLYLKALRTHPDEPFGPDEALDVARDMPATNAPGADYHYSNTGYLLLGLLIEEVTGKSWARNLEERVFDPVGMHDTTARQFAPDPHRLSSYQERDGELVDVTDGLWVPRGESGVVSTTADMIAFLEALVVDQTLLTPEMYEAMTDFRPTGGGGYTHGLGLWQIPVGGRMVIGRGGGTLGTSSGTWYDPASGTFVAMAATTDAADTNAVSRAFGATINASAAWNRVDDGDPLDVRNAAAADLTVTALRGATRLAVGDASIELDRALRATSTANTRFDDGSVLVVGDDSSATTADDGANDVRIARDHASAIGRDNHLIGLGGDDRLTGGNGNDRIDGGTGDDRLGGTRRQRRPGRGARRRSPGRRRRAGPADRRSRARCVRLPGRRLRAGVGRRHPRLRPEARRHRPPSDRRGARRRQLRLRLDRPLGVRRRGRPAPVCPRRRRPARARRHRRRRPGRPGDRASRPGRAVGRPLPALSPLSRSSAPGCPRAPRCSAGRAP